MTKSMLGAVLSMWLVVPLSEGGNRTMSNQESSSGAKGAHFVDARLVLAVLLLAGDIAHVLDIGEVGMINVGVVLINEVKDVDRLRCLARLHIRSEHMVSINHEVAWRRRRRKRDSR